MVPGGRRYLLMGGEMGNWLSVDLLLVSRAVLSTSNFRFHLERERWLYSCCCCCFNPFITLALIFALPPTSSRNSQIQGHVAGSSPPSPVRFVPSIFTARRLELFLPSSTRVELNGHAYAFSVKNVANNYKRVFFGQKQGYLVHFGPKTGNTKTK